MIYLYWYLGIGAVVLILMVTFHKLTKKKDDSSLSDILADLRPERKKLWFRLLNDVLGPALVGTLLVPFWPVLVFFKVKELVSIEPARGPIEDPKFAVGRNDLQSQLSVQEIEHREMVVDPMGAVPNASFGHLNAAWKRFLEGMASDDTIWTFSSHWTEWGRKELRQGYVIVRGGEIGDHFLTVWRDVEDDAVAENVRSEKKPGFDIPAWLRKQTD